MSNSISRRAFLKAAGASAAAVGAASLLGGCKQNGDATVVDVKVGDKVSSWNGLGVQLTSLFNIDTVPAQAGYEYVAVLVTVVNRTKDKTFAIGAQNLAEINAAYPLNTAEEQAANAAGYFHALSAATTDFVVTCDGKPVEGGAYVSLYDPASETFSDSTCLPPQRSGYIELVCTVPTGWQELSVTYTPTFVSGKSLTFTMSASDVAKG